MNNPPFKSVIAFTTALAISAGLSLSASVANAGELVSWALPEEAPFFYQEGNSFAGYGVEILNILHANTPNLQHELYSAGNYSRIVKEVAKGPRTCAFGLYKNPERVKIMHFSAVPTAYFYNIQLVMRRDTFDKLGKPENVSLAKLITDGEHVLGISRGRTYAKELNAVLEANKDARNILAIAQGNVFSSLAKMVQEGRMDFTFGYPEEYTYVAANYKGKTKLDLVTVPMTEITPLAYNYIACTKSPEGLAAITKLNAAVAKVRHTDAYRDTMTVWYGDNLIKMFNQAYKAEFLPMQGS